MSSEFSHKRILVTDDESAVAAVTARLLNRALECECATAESGADALRMLEDSPFDALVTDMAMPGMTGRELVERVVEKYPRLPVVVVTGHAETFPYLELVEAGAADFLVKPVHNDELIAKFVRLFREQDAIDQLLADINRLKELNVARALSEQKYRSLFQFSMNGMLLIEPQSLMIEETNEALCELTGKAADALRGTPFTELLSENDALRFQAALSHFRTTGQGTLADMSVHGAGEEPIRTDVSMSFVTLEGGTMLMLMLKDVTEQREMQAKIAELAAQDGLTGLYNHRMLFVELEAAIGRAQNDNVPVTLMILDLDNFKQCNDTHGHQTGDELLKSVGAIVRKQIRGATDRGFRYGGDEFAVLFVGIETDVAVRIAERMRTDFDHTEGYGTSMSVGIAALEDGMDANQLVHAADTALYEAKRGGKNEVSVAKSLSDSDLPI